MRKLALSDEILLQVEKPARYIGNEVNAVMKKKEDVDIRFLAERFEFVGGNIKNCILNAAFLAAADGDGQEVCMKHYLQAVRYEFIKVGKVFTRADFEPYASMIGL